MNKEQKIIVHATMTLLCNMHDADRKRDKAQQEAADNLMQALKNLPPHMRSQTDVFPRSLDYFSAVVAAEKQHSLDIQPPISRFCSQLGIAEPSASAPLVGEMDTLTSELAEISERLKGREECQTA